MRIVLDANVVIAAFATQGLCADIFRLCLNRFEIVLSENLLAEISKNLKKKLRLPAEMVSQTIRFLREHSVIAVPDPVNTAACRDPGDLHVLGVAKRTKASFIVTGDGDLLVLEKFGQTKIVTPKEFMLGLDSV